MTMNTVRIANIADCSGDKSARKASVTASFVFTDAVRYFAYCTFYYFYYFMQLKAKRMQAVI